VADPPKKPPRVSRSQARSSRELINCRHSVGATSNWLPKTIPHCCSELRCPHHLHNPSPLGILPRESVGLYASATTPGLGLHLAVTNIIHIVAFYGVSWQAECFLRALSQSSLEGEVADCAVPTEGQIHLKQQPEFDACSSAIKAIRPVHNAYVLKLNVLDIVIP
jgi:hypothetical protein